MKSLYKSARYNTNLFSYSIMKSCWLTNPEERPDFSAIRQLLARQLEEITDEYSYLKLDAGKDYYNVSYRDQAVRLL